MAETVYRHKEMRIEDFLKTDGGGMRLFFTGKIANGNALLRQRNISMGIPSWNIRCITPMELAKELVCADAAKKNEDACSVISFGSASRLMLRVLQKGDRTLFPKEVLSKETVADVLQCVSEMRENGVTDAFGKDRDAQNRLKELWQIKEAFEAELKGRGLYDKAACLEKALRVLEECDNLSLLLPWADGVRTGYLETERFCKLEWRLLESFAKKAGQEAELQKLCYLRDARRNGVIRERFFGAYGVANEVRRVVKELRDMQSGKMKADPRKVAVYYSSPAYLNHIRAEFDLAGIAYHLAEGRSALELDLMKFMLAVLQAAEEDHLYAALEMALTSRCATLQNAAEEGERVPGAADSYYKGIRAGIGWGKQRYLDYYEREKDGNNRAFAVCMRDFALLYEEKDTIAEICHKTWEFADKYTYKKNRERAMLKAAFQEREKELQYVESDAVSLKEKLHFLRTDLETLQAGEIEQENAVEILPIDGVSIMEYEQVYILGLSAVSFGVEDSQSPVLSDAEKRRYIIGEDTERVKVRLASERNQERREALEQSLCTFCTAEGEQVQVDYSYCYYDTVNMRETAESVFFRERRGDHALSRAEGFEKWAGYLGDRDFRIEKENLKEETRERIAVLKAEREKRREKYGKPKEETGQQPEAVYSAEEEQAEIEADMPAAAEKNPAPVPQTQAKPISSTGIRTLLECPLKYYYQYHKHIYLSEQLLPAAHQWLGFAQKGNLFHYFMEEYMDKAQNGEHELQEKIDEAVFEACYENAVKRMVQEEPYPSEAVFEQEKDYYRELTHDYVAYEHEKWAADARAGKYWKLVGAELKFGETADPEEKKTEVIYEGRAVKDDEEEQEEDVSQKTDMADAEPAAYRLMLNGSIDRLDARLGENGCLYYRIIDYKTGKKDKLAEKIMGGTQIQHIVYAMAAKRYYEGAEGRAALREMFGRELEKQGKTDFDGCEIEWAGYAFPYTKTDAEAVSETKEELYFLDTTDEAKKMEFDEAARCQIYRISGLWMDEQPEGALKEMDRTIAGKLEALRQEKADAGMKEFCGNNYCPYTGICRKWVGYDQTQEEEE